MALLQDLIQQIDDPALRDRILQETNKLVKQKKFGLVFEEHLPECTPLYDIPVRKDAKVALKSGKVNDFYNVLKIEGNTAVCCKKGQKDTIKLNVQDLVTIAEFGEPIYPYLKPIDSVCNAPDSDLWHTLIEADNYHALQLLEYLYAGKVDCIYIDPPYNTRDKDWKYNNDYVDSTDAYKHSKWLSMMQKRLKIAKKLLNPDNSVLIVTIDEKEYLHLGCLLEEMFSEARMQMISTVINPKGNRRDNEFSRCEEYIFFIYIGESYIVSNGSDMLRNADGENSEGLEDKTVRLRALLRQASNHGKRSDRPNLFYPLLFDETTGKFKGCGPVQDINADKNNYIAPAGTIPMWPIGSNGSELTWNLQPDTLMDKFRKHFVRFGKWDGQKRVGYYLSAGQEKNFYNGLYNIIGTDEDGAYIIELKDYSDKDVRPLTIWNKKSHSASENGTSLLNSIFQDRRFSFPKSVYAVEDTLRFFVGDKSNALIVDFFAGSGTTLHAVNLLNAEDNGHRRCIMVTNNEVSAEEAEMLSAQGYAPGDVEWEKLGIAHHVTWPRTVCSIRGQDVNGNPLTGNYGLTDDTYLLDEEDTVVSKRTGKPTAKKIYEKKKVQLLPQLENLNKADGFKANAAFFKLGFLDKNAVALGRQFKELLPILWMKAGAISKCPTLMNEELPNMMILPENKMAILLDEIYYQEFDECINKNMDIQTVFIVTDSETAYREMIMPYDGRECYQLYRDYLDNFRINTGR